MSPSPFLFCLIVFAASALNILFACSRSPLLDFKLVIICSKEAIASLLWTAHFYFHVQQGGLLFHKGWSSDQLGGNFVVGSNREMSSSLIFLPVRRLDGRGMRAEMRIRHVSLKSLHLSTHVILYLSPVEFLRKIAFSVNRCVQNAELSPFISSAQGPGTEPLQKGLQSLSGVDVKPD